MLEPPLIPAHHEDLDRGLVHDAGIDTLEPVIEPTQVFLIQIHVGVRAEVQISQPRSLGNMVGPGNYVSLLVLAGTLGVASLAHAGPHPEHRSDIRVVPASL